MKGGANMDDYTRKFNAAEDKDQQVHYILTTVYESLKEKGYDPINQLVGYILSADPTYITNHYSARTLIGKIDRDGTAWPCGIFCACFPRSNGIFRIFPTGAR